MKLRIVVNYAPRYRRGHAFHFVPPVTGIHLAAITPAGHEVEVIHEQVRQVPVDAAPDLVALSFFSGFARNAYSSPIATARSACRWSPAVRTCRTGWKRPCSTSTRW